MSFQHDADGFGFNLAGFKQLRLNDTHSIGQEVKKQVAIYYGLAVAE